MQQNIHRRLGSWTFTKLMVWAFAGSTGLAIIALRTDSCPD
jgi:hypothetical protein